MEVKSVKCGKCGKTMKHKKETRMGIIVHIEECSTCGKKLLDYDDAVKLQQKVLLELEEERTVLSIGNSIGITFPTWLRKIFRRGDKVRIRFDWNKMEATLVKS